MDPAALTAFLAPFLGALLERSEAAASEAVAKFGETTWEHAKRLWQRLSGRLEEEPAAVTAVADVAQAPDSAGARGSLAWQLEKLLGADTALAADLQQLWEQAQAAGARVTQVTASGA